MCMRKGFVHVLEGQKQNKTDRKRSNAKKRTLSRDERRLFEERADMISQSFAKASVESHAFYLMWCVHKPDDACVLFKEKERLLLSRNRESVSAENTAVPFPFFSSCV